MSESEVPGRRVGRGGSVLNRLAPYLFVTPFVVLFLVFMVAPILMAAWMSLFEVTRSGLGLTGEGTTTFAGLGNYQTALSREEFVDSFGRVLLFGTVQVPIMLGLALLLALLFDSAVTRFKPFLQLVVFLPYAVPTVVAALLWGFLYQPGVSPIVGLLQHIGVEPRFLEPGTVLWSIANVSVWSYTGVNMVILYTALQAVPREIYEAARVDGAGEARIALRMKVPMIAPALFLTLLFSIIGNLQLFNEPSVIRTITSNVTANYTPNMAIFQTTTIGNNPNLGAAMAVVVALVTFVVSITAGRVSGRIRAR
jgi:multiple sugar transport system permease protein